MRPAHLVRGMPARLGTAARRRRPEHPGNSARCGVRACKEGGGGGRPGNSSRAMAAGSGTEPHPQLDTGELQELGRRDQGPMAWGDQGPTGSEADGRRLGAPADSGEQDRGLDAAAAAVGTGGRTPPVPPPPQHYSGPCCAGVQAATPRLQARAFLAPQMNPDCCNGGDASAAGVFNSSNRPPRGWRPWRCPPPATPTAPTPSRAWPVAAAAGGAIAAATSAPNSSPSWCFSGRGQSTDPAAGGWC